MSSCSLNTEASCEALVSAVQDIVSARDADLDYGNELLDVVGGRFFITKYPRLSDAIDRAAEIINPEDVK